MISLLLPGGTRLISNGMISAAVGRDDWGRKKVRHGFIIMRYAMR